jgi:hypothetical protein
LVSFGEVLSRTRLLLSDTTVSTVVALRREATALDEKFDALIAKATGDRKRTPND